MSIELVQYTSAGVLYHEGAGTVSDAQGTEKTLLDLGPGAGSAVERIKVESRYLRGSLADELAQPTTHFSGDAVQLLKFHGSYQQEDRDARRAMRARPTAQATTGAEGSPPTPVAAPEKAYQFMLRSRIPGGAMTAAQYLAHDRIAGRYANGTLRITTRQGIQLHGVLKGDLRRAIRGINRSLLSTLSACGDVNRNVMACAAPTASRAQAHIQEVAQQVALRLAPQSEAYHELWLDGEQVSSISAPPPAEVVEPLYGPTYLPRKFKVGVAYPGDNCVDVFSQDVGLVAELDAATGETLAGFTVLVGGGMGATHNKPETHPLLATPLGFVTPDEVLAVVETIVTVQRDYGDRTNRKHARMKYLIEERGIAWFRAQVEERLGRPLADPHPVAFTAIDDHLGWHQQPDGRWFLGLFVENGRVKDDGRRKLRTALRQVAKTFGPNLRLTAQQNVLLTDIAEEQRAPLAALLRKHGIETEPATLGIRRFTMACPALPTCGLALAEAERVLPRVIDDLQAELVALGLGEERLSVRMTGCPNGCARPYLGDIGLVGRSKDLYTLFVGGDWGGTRLNTVYADAVPFADLVATLRPLLTLWRDRRTAGETFGDFCHRLGGERLRALVAELAQPHPAERPGATAGEVA